MTLRVLLVDDHALVRSSLRMVLAAAAGIEVAGEAGDGGEAVRLAREVRPDVVLMDVRMPGMDGIAATAAIAGEAKVLVLTTFDDDEYVYGALRAGASGFLVKDMDLDDIVAAVRVVAAGEALLAPTVTRRLIEQVVRDPGRPSPCRRVPASVTDRELEVLELIAAGASNAEIADRLRITNPTVKTYVGRLLTKMDARDRVHLVILAYEAGLREPGQDGLRPRPRLLPRR
ncbi:response regulator [Actinoplanes sp. CA-030573]|uniref:response regulator n=1 Tax=Actinoplanes sp. CA-030573 TaxID=3239898 RepID=UPI003D947B6E